MTQPPPMILPSGYQLVEVLTRGSAAATVRARGLEGEVVLRLSSHAGAEAERRTELAVLAALRAPGLASLCGHGTVEGQDTSFVARTFVEGSDLAAWAARLEGDAAQRSLAIGKVAARLCEPLAALHEAGFVHADLKAENVIVDDGGAPTLTDFGLARAEASSQEGAVPAGSWYSVAPEVLLGHAPTPRSDLFALGMMLARLLVRDHATPARFYARFPAVDALTALEIDPASLPEWSRDVIASLLDREPDRRPSSARSVGASLCARLGLARPRGEARAQIHWPVRTGREALVAATVTELSESSARCACLWWWLPEHEDASAACEDLRLAAGIAGVLTTRRDAGPLQAVASAELDRWVGLWTSESDRRVVFCALPEGQDLDRQVAHWARTVVQASQQASPGPRALIVFASHAPDAAVAEAFEVVRVRGAELGEVEGFLSRVLEEPSAERKHEVARWILADHGGASTLVQRRLDRLAAHGLFLAGDERLRLRKGALPEAADQEFAREGAARLSADARRLAAAIASFGRPVSFADAASSASLAPDRAARARSELLESSCVRRDAGRDVVRFVGREDDLGLAETEWVALARATAERERARGNELESWPHAWRAAGLAPAAERAAVVRSIVAAARLERERGAVERALDLFARLERASQKSRRALEPDLVGEHALVWIAAGAVDRALETIAPLAEHPVPAVGALVSRVRGLSALQRAQYEEALAELEKAARLDPFSAGDVAVARARVFFDARREMELDDHVEGALSDPRVGERERANLRTLWAMSYVRRGDVSRARELLGAVSSAGAADADPQRAAALALNLSTLERRLGHVDEALAQAERGLAGYEAIGFLPGIAQARVFLGGLLRDAGRLSEASGLLESAALVRGRLGDPAGAALARGSLGLVLADRGHARAALNELARAAVELGRQSRTVDAALLEARMEELRARIGAPVSGAERTRSKAGAKALDADPRALLARARAAWLRRDTDNARGLAIRARDLAHGLQQAGLEREADAVVREIENRPRGFDPARSTEDERILALLAGGGDLTQMRAVADDLARRGRDDRAARVYFALGARARASDDAKLDLAAADRLFETCAAGLLPREAEALKKTLLGMPDPFPLDYATLDARGGDEEDFPMDILALLEINRRLVAQEALPDLLGAIVDSALHVTGAERGFVVLVEDGEIAIQTAMDSRRGDIAAPEVELSHSIVRQALASSGVVRFSNAVDDPELAGAASVAALDLRSILCAPFDIEAGSRGVVYVDHRVRKGAFDERAERLLGLLADQAALAVRQVRRVEEIRRLNRELEREVAHKDSDLRAAREALRAASLVPPATGLVGESSAMRTVHELIARAATSKLPVLVTGASGTGKELAARALHAQSERVEGPFIAENCAALPAALIEAELFGYKKGAYTGADADRPGLFERASGGTLFLDEIGELPLELQAKLLRVLETGEVRRLGDSVVRQTDVRLVAATNRDLDTEVRENRFRADLLYRLDALRVAMPALEQRLDDIPRLVEHFLRLEGAKNGTKRHMSPEVLAKLCARAWPGNVRELSNEVARLCVLSSGDITDPLLVRVPHETSAPSFLDHGAIPTLAELERLAIQAAIERAGGDKTKAAEMLGISRAKVYQRVKEWRDGEASITSAS